MLPDPQTFLLNFFKVKFGVAEGINRNPEWRKLEESLKERERERKNCKVEEIKCKVKWKNKEKLSVEVTSV